MFSSSSASLDEPSRKLLLAVYRQLQRPRGRARIALLVVTVVLLAVSARPVAAHPFGPPPTATVSADGKTVVVDWASAADDAAAIGEALGLLPPGTVAAYQESVVQVAPPAGDIEAFSASPQLRDYLLEHIVVEQDAQACEGTVEPITDFIDDGAVVVYECGEEAREVALTITMLHDIHEAYRTFGVSQRDAQPPQAVFTVAQPTHVWRFGVDERAQSASARLLWLIGGAAALAVAALAALVVLAGRRR